MARRAWFGSRGALDRDARDPASADGRRGHRMGAVRGSDGAVRLVATSRAVTDRTGHRNHHRRLIDHATGGSYVLVRNPLASSHCLDLCERSATVHTKRCHSFSAARRAVLPARTAQRRCGTRCFCELTALNLQSIFRSGPAEARARTGNGTSAVTRDRSVTGRVARGEALAYGEGASGSLRRRGPSLFVSG